MSVELDPPELDFKRPFTREVCQVLHLLNKNQESVVFKVKTTAPKHYCVRPNSGRIEPGKHVDVQVLLQGMKEDPPLDAKCKDKFLVQSVAVTSDMEYSNVTAIFDRTSKGSVQERKIRVNWLEADKGPGSGERGDTNGAAISEEEPPAYTSINGNFETPATGIPEKSSDTTSPTSPPEKTKRESSTPPLAEMSASATSVRSPSGGAATSSSAEDSLRAQLTEAHAQIQKLKDKLADQGLRRRNIGGDNSVASNPTVQTQQAAAEAGVPVQLVAGLCLISFLLAYIFF